VKIGYKFTIIMIALSLLVLGSVGITLLVQARTYIVRFSHERAMTTAREYAGIFGGYFVSYWYTAQTTARLMERYQSIGVNTRRYFLNRTLEGILLSNPTILGIWSIWEPNALEGNDALRLGTEGTNHAGRFAPNWYRIGGEIRVRALDDFDLSEDYDDYYRAAIRSSPGAIRDPFHVSIAGRQVLASSITATIYSGTGDNRRVVGVVGIDFDTNRIQQTTLRLFPFGDGVTKVFSNDGTVVGHRLYPYRIGTSILDTERDMGGPYMYELEMAVRQGTELDYTHFHPGFQEWMLMYITPIQIGTTNTPWSLAIVIPRRSVMAPVHAMELSALLIAIIVIALIIPVVIFLSRSLAKPILTVTNTLKDISEGEGDLTRTIEINSNDEVGNLAHYFNLTLQKLRGISRCSARTLPKYRWPCTIFPRRQRKLPVPPMSNRQAWRKLSVPWKATKTFRNK